MIDMKTNVLKWECEYMSGQGLAIGKEHGLVGLRKTFPVDGEDCQVYNEYAGSEAGQIAGEERESCEDVKEQTDRNEIEKAIVSWAMDLPDGALKNLVSAAYLQLEHQRSTQKL